MDMFFNRITSIQTDGTDCSLPPAATLLFERFHTLLVVLNLAGGMFFLALVTFLGIRAVAFSGFHLALFTLAVVEKTLDRRDEEDDAEYQPCSDEDSYQDCLKSCHGRTSLSSGNLRRHQWRSRTQHLPCRQEAHRHASSAGC